MADWPRAAARSRCRLERRIDPRVQLAEQGWTSEEELASIDDPLHAAPRNGLEAFGLWNNQPPFLGALDDPPSDRVFRVTFDSRREGECLVGCRAPGGRDLDHTEGASGQRPRLVEEHRRKSPPRAESRDPGRADTR